MKLFKVKAGTACHVIQDGQEWDQGNLLSHETEIDHTFETEEIRIDPVGKIGCHKGHVHTIGGFYAERGFYAFKREASIWIILVHAVDVEVI